MICLVYCILRAGLENLPEIAGIGGKPVRYLPVSGLAAAFSEVEGPLAPEVRALFEFDAVVKAFGPGVSVIPARFGNYFASTEKLENFVRENARGLTELLDLLGGAKEMEIRVLARRQSDRETPPDSPPEVPKPEPRTGRQYLAQRKAYFETANRLSGRKDEMVRLLGNTFQGLFTRMKSEDAPAGKLAAEVDDDGWDFFYSASFLVPEDFIEAFRQRFSELDLEDDARFLLSGPWPPYSFADFHPI